jgi:S1-C subfamily serine protease/DNA-directed RNA polymerase subunit RPC12/RpoP
MSDRIKGACVHCGGHIAYDDSNVGRTIQCPHCSESITLGGRSPATKPVSPAANPMMNRKIGLALCALLAVTLAIALPVMSKSKQAKERLATEQAARRNLEEERLRAEAEKAKAEAELTKAKLREEEQSRAAAKAREEAQAKAAFEVAQRKGEEKQRAEEATKKRVKSNPAVWALWQEQDHDAIRIISTRTGEATVQYKGGSVIANYDDMPDWLKSLAQTKHQQDGEAKGLIREVNGKTYDLRTSPAGWVALPAAEVIQIVNDGYLLIDVASLKQPYAQTKVFKLKHNGLPRILNNGDRIQMTAMSVGTWLYENRRYEAKRVPVYDPGMPTGPLRERVVAMHAPSIASGRSDAPKVPAEEASSTGSGFFISEDGLFVTNAHVVEDAIKIEVKGVTGKKKATVLRIDKEKDLALLRVSVVDGTVPALRISTNNFPIGTQVFTIGYPLVDLQGTQPKFTDGKISSVAGLHDNPDEIQISVAVQPGNSGGPLADNNGDIVGVVVARLNDFNTIAAAGTIPQNLTTR